jgi:type II secretory pathway component PulK
VQSEGTTGRTLNNERGIALMIVLLVTALLIALVFEFAYGTRVSLRATVNFRDSQRAYFLARAGVNFAGALLCDNLKKNKLQENLEQRDWQEVPVQAGNDMSLRVRWEDEGGKIDIRNVSKGSDGYNRMVILFTNLGIDQDKLDTISSWMIEEKRNFHLVTELHRFLSDEEYRKIQDDVTAESVPKIDINTASSEVLQSLGLDSTTAEAVIERRTREPFTKETDFSDFLGRDVATKVGGQWTLTSNVFLVDSFATAGGYTKQVEAIITRTNTGFRVSYWREL